MRTAYYKHADGSQERDWVQTLQVAAILIWRSILMTLQALKTKLSILEAVFLFQCSTLQNWSLSTLIFLKINILSSLVTDLAKYNGIFLLLKQKISWVQKLSRF